MEAVRWHELKTLFARALALPPAQRPSFLDRTCGSKPVLRAEASSLLALYPKAQAYFDRLEASVVVPGPIGPGTAPCRRNQRVSHYLVLEPISTGGMGVVYKAWDTRLPRFVALKFLPVYLSADAEAQERFIREAHAASTLDHPNVVTIYEIDRTAPAADPPDEGHLFIAMAYYAGETLKQKVARGPLPVQDVLYLALQITRGLGCVHRHHIVHRDVKPANLLVTDDGLVKIVDFGLALMARVRLTKTKTMLGTVAYMSPEQAQAEPLDHRTDLWSLGAVLYELLTARLPFGGDYEQAIVYSILNTDPVPLADLRSDIPPALDAIVRTCLEKNPDERYQTAAAVEADLERVWRDVHDTLNGENHATQRPVSVGL